MLGKRRSETRYNQTDTDSLATRRHSDTSLLSNNTMLVHRSTSYAAGSMLQKHHRVMVQCRTRRVLLSCYSKLRERDLRRAKAADQEAKNRADAEKKDGKDERMEELLRKVTECCHF